MFNGYFDNQRVSGSTWFPAGTTCSKVTQSGLWGVSASGHLRLAIGQRPAWRRAVPRCGMFLGMQFTPDAGALRPQWSLTLTSRSLIWGKFCRASVEMMSTDEFGIPKEDRKVKSH